jgi:hypothetical protein
MESADIPDRLIGPWSKLVAYAARLALILQLLRKVCGEVDEEDVDAESLRRALVLIAYFQSHARVVYPRLHASPRADKVRKAIDWIRRHGGACCPSDLVRGNVAGIERKSQAEQLMKELEDRGYGRCERQTAANHRQVLRFVAKPQPGSSRVQ